jgi:hypothetical protein
LLKELGSYIADKIGIKLGEVLFFLEKESIVFGAATPLIISAKEAPLFQALTLKMLSSPLSYATTPQLPDQSTNVNTKIGGRFIIIGSLQDSTINTVAKSQSFNHRHTGVLLQLEDLTTQWDFKCTNGKLTFFINSIAIKEIASIYYRYFYQDDEKIDAIELLHICLENFDGLVYGRGGSEYFNSSKPLQLSNLLPSIQTYSSIALPDTIIIKGASIDSIVGSLVETQLITKSISGVRSIVVNNNTFDKWGKAGLQALPTLFQKQIMGVDIRVHVLHQQIIATKIDKDAIDYRYAMETSLKSVSLPQDVIQFCLSVSQIEKNPLVGIDLIQTAGKYILLESNATPGWDYFFKEEDTKEQVCYALIISKRQT